jgi:hypothetical protein
MCRALSRLQPGLPARGSLTLEAPVGLRLPIRAPPRRPGRRRFVARLSLLALQATGAVWSAERHESEQRSQRDLLHAQRHIAVTLQENLVHPLPTIAGLDLALVTETAHARELETVRTAVGSWIVVSG